MTTRQRWLIVAATVCLAAAGCRVTVERTPAAGGDGQAQTKPAQTQAATQAQAPAQDQDPELQIGQEVFDQLKAKGEIIESSPLYDELKPIADAITKAAQPRYNHPFKFYLVHEEQPNAFATPGGNVYVVDSLLYFVKNKEQLRGRCATRSRTRSTTTR